ncbi:IS1595 family transposase ISSsu9 [Candidatus Ecksteinia adelgidicola]|nr:IS1595 family transposase ISSsu9 [Candidatus Ecksteinia adelgidicola]
MIISLIASLGKNRIIGVNNAIPWYLPADLKWFKINTLNKPVIMGRKTFHSIGHALPNRINIVLSTNYLKTESNIIWVHSLKEALIASKNAREIMIIGGEHVYKQFLTYADRLYLTHINIVITGDTYFPYYKSIKWKRSFIKYHTANKKNPYDYYFEILDQDKF